MGTEWFGRSLLEEPIGLRYVRRWERWLAKVWPPKRRHLAMMERLANFNVIELHAEYNKALSNILLYGSNQQSSGLTPEGTSANVKDDLT